MPSFTLIVDTAQAHAFHSLGTPAPLSDAALARLTFEAPALPHWVRETTLRLNETQVTAMVLQQQNWSSMFFDMDSTVIREESIVELARAAGKQREVHEITERAMAGELDFVSALRARVAMLRGVPASVIDRVKLSLTINPGMHALARSAKIRGWRLFLVSGGFNPLAQQIAQELGFDAYHANELEIKGEELTGQLLGSIVDAEAKAQFLRTTCSRLQLPLETAVVVGDGANDLPMLRLAGAAIGYHPKQVLLPHINGANFYDHTALIYALHLSD